jgi:quercetin dioxygenase-like cupin family protein
MSEAQQGTHPVMSSPRVVHDSDVPPEAWADPVRGEVGFRTLFGEGDRATDALTLGTTELPPGGWLGLHRHAPAEVYYVLQGEAVVTLEGVEHHVTAGSAVFIPGSAEHGIRNVGDSVVRFVYVFPVGSFADVVYEFTAEG